MSARHLERGSITKKEAFCHLWRLWHELFLVLLNGLVKGSNVSEQLNLSGLPLIASKLRKKATGVDN